MKRMFAPDDEGKPFIARWNMLARILLIESSIKHVMRAAMDYADFDDGSNCHPSNERLARETGYNERTVRLAWAVMRGLKMAERVSRGVPHRGLADDYVLQIPHDWQALPILGPYGRKFTCLFCGKLFIPQGNCKVKPKTDDVTFILGRMCFCPAPRANKGREDVSCETLWSKRSKKAGAKEWNALGQERWKHFRVARGDDW